MVAATNKTLLIIMENPPQLSEKWEPLPTPPRVKPIHAAASRGVYRARKRFSRGSVTQAPPESVRPPKGLDFVRGHKTHQRTAHQFHHALCRQRRSLQVRIDIVGAGCGRVDEEPPVDVSGDLRNREFLRFAAGMEQEQDMMVGRVRCVAPRDRREKTNQAAVAGGPVHGVPVEAMPTHVRQPARPRRLSREEVGAPHGGLSLAKFNERPTEAEQAFVLRTSFQSNQEISLSRQ